MTSHALGLNYGSDSVRALLVDALTGAEVAPKWGLSDCAKLPGASPELLAVQVFKTRYLDNYQVAPRKGLALRAGRGLVCR
jgi:hypothetical protein